MPYNFYVSCKLWRYTLFKKEYALVKKIKIVNTVASVVILGVGSFSLNDDYEPLDVRRDVVSISEIRPSIFVSESSNESQKRELNKENPKSLQVQKVAREARWLAKHGGVTGTCYGCATARMKQLVKKLVVLRFEPTGASATRIALCLVGAESGFNPGTISSTNDWGVGQINRTAHESSHPSWWQPHVGFRYAVLDPVYNVGIMWSMSRRGRSWTSWTGTWGRGMCRL